MLRRLPRRRRDGVAAAALGRGSREEADQGGEARHIDGVAYPSLLAAAMIGQKKESCEKPPAALVGGCFRQFRRYVSISDANWVANCSHWGHDARARAAVD